jgi:hypothetical protein
MTAMRKLSKLLTVGVAFFATACAARQADPTAFAITAHSAYGEARTQAAGWASDAELQYVEGASVTNRGTVQPDAGYWRFVFGADSRSQQYVVTIAPTSVNGEERTPQGPPGFVLGDRTLSTDWIDSPAVVEAIGGYAADTRVQMFLVPTTPARWIVGDIEIDARTGDRL